MFMLESLRMRRLPWKPVATVRGGVCRAQVVVSFRGTEASKAQDVMVDAAFLPKQFPVHPADWQLLSSLHLQRCVTHSQVPLSPFPIIVFILSHLYREHECAGRPMYTKARGRTIMSSPCASAIISELRGLPSQ